MLKTTFAAWVAGACLLAAQETGTRDLEARRESVDTLKQHITMRQKRLDEVAAEIRQRGQKMDEQIESLVKILTSVKDSQDSKRRISQLKAEAVGGLKRMIQVYKTERAKVLEQLRSDGGAPVEALSKDMDTIDKLVEKRANDIIELVKSMPGGEDVQKYETESDYTYRNGVTYENSRVSEEWRQNRRDKVQSEKGRREVQQALEKAITDLESRRDAIAAGIAAGGLSASDKELREEELARTNALLAERKTQLAEVRLPSAAPSDTASKNEADDMKDLFESARRDVADAFTKTIQLYHQAAAERTKIHGLQQNLEARIKWLSENDPATKKPE
jgi:hypothetical protein